MHYPPLSPKKSLRLQILFWPVGIVLFFYFLSLIKSILLPFVVGILAAYFLDPAVRRMRRLNFSRSLSAATITISFFTIVIVGCIVLVPPIVHQLINLVQDLPDYVQDMQDKYSSQVQDFLSQFSPEQTHTIKNAAANLGAPITAWTEQLFQDVIRSVHTVLSVVSLIFITPIVAFYLLRDWEVLVQRFHDLLPRKHQQVILEQLDAIDRTLSGFIRGQTNVCLTMACYYSLMLSIVGLKFALGIGIMTGLLLFVPFVGFASCFAISMIVGLIQFGLEPHLVAVAAVYLCGMLIEGSLLTPRLVGHQVGLHPVWIIFGMLAGAALFGFVGVLISVPVTSVIGVLVRFAINRYMSSDIYLT